MAEGFLRSFNPQLELFSAGTEPAEFVNPNAVQVMEEIGIDISMGKPDLVDEYLKDAFDYVITVCDHAKETCPLFPKAVRTIHIGFEDPSGKATEEYEKTLEQIEQELLPIIREELCQA